MKVATAALTLINSWTNTVKQKLILALTQIVDRMGLKAKSFWEIDWIAGVFGKSINEAAQEVRQEAKKGLLALRSVFDGKDLENLLQRNLTDREYEKVDEFFQKEASGRFMITNTRRKQSSSTIKSSSKSRRISKASLNDSRDSDSSQRMTSQQFRSKPKMGKTSGGFEVISPEILQNWDDIKTGFKRGDWE